MIKDLREEGVSSIDIWGEVYSRQSELPLQGPSGEERPGKHRVRKEAAAIEVQRGPAAISSPM